MVPDTKSRAALGEISDSGLYEVFQSRYGAPGTPAFEAARHNFIVSQAGYAVASYIVQTKDRHNGNILVDSAGRIVHIDFGFIFEISPGGEPRLRALRVQVLARDGAADRPGREPD